MYVQNCFTFPFPTSWGPIKRRSLSATLSHEISRDTLKHIASMSGNVSGPLYPQTQRMHPARLVESCESDSVTKSNCLRILTPISTKTHTCTVIECDAIILVYSGTVCTRRTTHTKEEKKKRSSSLQLWLKPTWGPRCCCCWRSLALFDIMWYCTIFRRSTQISTSNENTIAIATYVCHDDKYAGLRVLPTDGKMRSTIWTTVLNFYRQDS